ncbi:p22K [Mastadenovirus porcusquartum]|nr:p22K [Porcine mastadenovirus B]QFX65721.1 p22K [Porcine mastadenovirus B]
MLYHHGVSLPRNIIYYYNSHYRLVSGAGGQKESTPPAASALAEPAPRPSHQGAPKPDLSHPVYRLPANSGAGRKAVHREEPHLQVSSEKLPLPPE